MKKSKKNLTDFGEFDIELFVATEIFDAESLHYGLWKKDDELNIANGRKAQERYTQKLIDLIPSDVKTVLDVGSGIGDVSKAMSQRGFKVTSVSPDKNHTEFYKSNPEIEFHNKTIEEFETKKKYDLVLYCESQNYFSIEVGVQKAKKFLNKNGYLLISGMFEKHENARQGGVKIHKKNDYVAAAQEESFKLIKEIDITKQTTPTIKLASYYLEKYKKLTSKFKEYYITKLPFYKKIMVKLLVGKQLKKLNQLVKYYEVRFDTDWYEANLEYVRLLFKKTGQ